jgi:hypothetical protein
MADLSHDDPGLWISLSEIARRRRVSLPTIFEKVKRLEGAGKLEVRPGKGREKLVNLAAYDAALGETTDLSAAQAAATVRGEPFDAPPLAEPAALAPEPAATPGRTFSTAQAAKAQYDAGIRAIDFARERDKVLPIDGEHGVDAAMQALGGAIVAAANRQHYAAAQITSIALKEGERGVRQALKKLSRDLLAAYCDALRELVAKGKGLEQLGGYAVELPDATEGEAEL